MFNFGRMCRALKSKQVHQVFHRLRQDFRHSSTKKVIFCFYSHPHGISKNNQLAATGGDHLCNYFVVLYRKPPEFKATIHSLQEENKAKIRNLLEENSKHPSSDSLKLHQNPTVPCICSAGLGQAAGMGAPGVIPKLLIPRQDSSKPCPAWRPGCREGAPRGAPCPDKPGSPAGGPVLPSRSREGDEREPPPPPCLLPPAL